VDSLKADSNISVCRINISRFTRPKLREYGSLKSGYWPEFNIQSHLSGSKSITHSDARKNRVRFHGYPHLQIVSRKLRYSQYAECLIYILCVVIFPRDPSRTDYESEWMPPYPYILYVISNLTAFVSKIEMGDNEANKMQSASFVFIKPPFMTS